MEKKKKVINLSSSQEAEHFVSELEELVASKKTVIVCLFMVPKRPFLNQAKCSLLEESGIQMQSNRTYLRIRQDSIKAYHSSREGKTSVILQCSPNSIIPTYKKMLELLE